MARINMGRVILGGLLAGLVVNVSEFIFNGLLFAKDMEDAMRAMNRPPPDNSAIIWFALVSFAMTIIAVWLYAAIRPRFGAGVRTATIAAGAVWLLAYAYPSVFMAVLQMFPTKLLVIGLIWGLPEIIIATIAGAWVYQES